MRNKEWLQGIAAALLLGLIWLGWDGGNNKIITEQSVSVGQVSQEIRLPVQWHNLGYKLVKSGVIDKNKLEQLYKERSEESEELENLLSEKGVTDVIITDKNANLILNLLWALGLSNHNPILTEGPMNSMDYGGDPGRFASTGGWTLSQSKAMDYYNNHEWIILNEKQQALVEKVSQNIYRPCCGNSTYFPDCNHGMAMLALLELMAENEVSEQEMYGIALAVNRLWFPGAYELIEKYFAERGIKWEEIDPQIILGREYSSSEGIRKIASQVEVSRQGGVSCGV